MLCRVVWGKIMPRRILQNMSDGRRLAMENSYHGEDRTPLNFKVADSHSSTPY